MTDRYEDRYRRDPDRYRGDQYERGYGREDRGFTERASDEVRSWFGDEEAERRRRMDERERARERSREYGAGYEQEWGDYPYRGEAWRGVDYGRRDYGPYAGEAGTSRYGYGTESYNRRYGGHYGLGWEAGRRGEFAGRGPKGYQRSDARINDDVCDRLVDAPDVDASDIEVRTNNGEVTLSGNVTDREQKRRAEELIENVSGVREIHNSLRVRRWQEGGTTTQAAATGTTPAGTRR